MKREYEERPSYLPKGSLKKAGILYLVPGGSFAAAGYLIFQLSRGVMQVMQFKKREKESQLADITNEGNQIFQESLKTNKSI